MAIALLYGQSTQVYHEDRRGGGIVPASASLRLLDETGAVVESPTVTLPTADTTVSASPAPTRSLFTVADATGIAVGEACQIAIDGELISFVPETIDSGEVEPTASLPVAPESGDTVKGLRMTATIAGLAESQVGDGYRVEWQYTDAAGKTYTHTQSASVVRWLPPVYVTADDVREHVARVHPGAHTASRAIWSDVAKRVERRIERAIESTGRRAYLYGDSDTFNEASYHAMRLALAEVGFYPPGVDSAQYAQVLQREVNHHMRTALGGLADYDTDGDGKPDDREPARLFSVRIVG